MARNRTVARLIGKAHDKAFELTPLAMKERKAFNERKDKERQHKPIIEAQNIRKGEAAKKAAEEALDYILNQNSRVPQSNFVGV